MWQNVIEGASRDWVNLNKKRPGQQDGKQTGQDRRKGH